jgi:hypothetical protein
VSAATITLDPHDRSVVIVRFRYDDAAVSAIRMIPGRRWDPDRRYWTVPVDTVNVARRALERIGMTVHVDLGRDTPPPRPASPSTEAAIDAVLAAVPTGQHRRVLRAIAAATHPDVGGDLNLSKYVNNKMGQTT